MKQEVKEMWVAALRSGVYKQGTMGLRDTNNNFCCLGVLCDIAVQNGVIREGQPPGEEDEYYRYGRRGESATLPVEVIEWAGMADSTGKMLGGPGQPRSLVQANDGQDEYEIRSHTFDEIADLIEEHF